MHSNHVSKSTDQQIKYAEIRCESYEKENRRWFALLSCLSTPYIKFTDPNGIPAGNKKGKERDGKAILRFCICTPAYRQVIAKRAYQSVYQMQEAFSVSNPQPKPAIHCCTMEFSCPVIRLDSNSSSHGKQPKLL